MEHARIRRGRFVRSAAGAGIAPAAPRPEIQKRGLAITLVLVAFGQEAARQQRDAHDQSQSKYERNDIPRHCDVTIRSETDYCRCVAWGHTEEARCTDQASGPAGG